MSKRKFNFMCDCHCIGHDELPDLLEENASLRKALEEIRDCLYGPGKLYEIRLIVEKTLSRDVERGKGKEIDE